MFNFLQPKTKEIIKVNEVTEKLIMDYCNTFLTNQLNENEMKQFLTIAMTFQLNPFKREIYCIPYGQGQYRKLSIITGYEVYLKRAYATGKIEYWKTDIGKDDLGTYALIVIKRKDWDGIFEHKVYMQEYNTNNSLWKNKPYTMLKKVVTAQGFRLCFPEEFGGMPYTNDELPDEMTKDVTPKKKEKKVISEFQGEKHELKTDYKKEISKTINENEAKIIAEENINKMKNETNKKEILAKARPLTAKIKEDGKVQYFIDLSKSNKDYTEDQYLLDLQYLQGLEKEPEFNDDHMQEGIFDKFKPKDK